MTNKEQHIVCVTLTPVYQRTLRFDALEMGFVNRAQAVDVSASGKGTNIARALKTLGDPPFLVGFLGGDTGAYVRSEFDALDIPAAWTQTAAPTRMCHTLINKSTGTATELVEEAQPPSADEWASFRETYRKVLSGASLVMLAGTLSPGNPPETYRALAREARAAGVPTLIDSHKAPLLLALDSRPLMAKLNVHELGLTWETEIDSDDALIHAAQCLLDTGAASVCVTHGARKTWLVEPDRITLFTPPTIEALNPIGSGDAMSAGIAHSLRAGESLIDAVRHGIACGTANALTLLPAHFDPAEVQRLLPLVHVE